MDVIARKSGHGGKTIRRCFAVNTFASVARAHDAVPGRRFAENAGPVRAMESVDAGLVGVVGCAHDRRVLGEIMRAATINELGHGRMERRGHEKVLP